MSLPPRPSIMNSSYEIQIEARRFFPEAAIFVGDEEGFKLKLSDQLPNIDIKCVIDKQKFADYLLRLSQLSKEELKGENLDEKAFAKNPPISLRDKLSINRAIYEGRGGSCAYAIRRFLEHPEDLDQAGLLRHLGLHPSMVEEDLQGKHAPYFQAFFDELNARANMAALYAVFDVKYPKTAKHLAGRQGKKEAATKGEDSYQKVVEKLKENVIGQDHAVEQVAKDLVLQKKDATKAVYLFVGPSGIGKTELAKAIAKSKKTKLIFFAMNQYQSEIDYSKLMGSSAGYIGSTDKPHFAKKLEELNPSEDPRNKNTLIVKHGVILFDEFEKAHSIVKQSLLTLFDEGAVEVNYTRGDENLKLTYKFESCLIIATSNLFQTKVLAAFQAGQKPDAIEKDFRRWNIENPHIASFSPELLNRMKIVPFGPIPEGVIFQKLIKLKLIELVKELKEKTNCKEVVLENELGVLAYLEKKHYGDGTDIRKLKRFTEDIIKGIVAREAEFGGFINRKITFFLSEGGFFSYKLAVFLPNIEYYGNLDGETILI